MTWINDIIWWRGNQYTPWIKVQYNKWMWKKGERRWKKRSVQTVTFILEFMTRTQELRKARKLKGSNCGENRCLVLDELSKFGEW